MKMKIVLSAIVAAIAGSITLNCTNTIGNGSDIGNAVVVGKLYAADGVTPAAGVCVHIRPKNSLADTAGTGLPKRLTMVDSVITDSDGRFAFDSSLNTGTFVIEAASGNDAVLIDSVLITNRDLTDSLPPDTLKPAGALKGVIKLSEGGDKSNIFVLAFGIDRFVRVDSDGKFKFQNLAEAVYDLRIISSLADYRVLDINGISVRSKDTTDMDTIELPFIGIPTPKNVRISYDTLKQIVMVTWDRADTVLVKGYNVYRRNVDSNTVLARKNTSPITDTLYRDSTGIQDQTYEYRVAAVDKNATEGTKSAGNSVFVASAFLLSDSTLLNLPFLNNPHAFAVDNDANFYIPKGSVYANHVTVFSQLGDSVGVIAQDSSADISQVDVNSSGSIYLLDPTKDRIYIFAKGGVLRTTFSILPSATKMALGANGSTYVTHYGSLIARYDTSGNILDSLSYAADDIGKLVTGNDGKLYDSHASDKSIRIFDTALSPTITSMSLTTGGTRPFLVQAVDSSGNLFVLYRQDITDGVHTNRIFVYKATGELVAIWGNFKYVNYAVGIKDIRISGRKAYVLVDLKPAIMILSFTIPPGI